MTWECIVATALLAFLLMAPFRPLSPDASRASSRCSVGTPYSRCSAHDSRVQGRSLAGWNGALCSDISNEPERMPMKDWQAGGIESKEKSEAVLVESSLIQSLSLCLSVSVSVSVCLSVRLSVSHRLNLSTACGV